MIGKATDILRPRLKGEPDASGALLNLIYSGYYGIINLIGDIVCGLYLAGLGFAGSCFNISSQTAKVGKASDTLARVLEMMDTPPILLDEQKSRASALLFISDVRQAIELFAQCQFHQRSTLYILGKHDMKHDIKIIK